jgi:hypothetical protein
VTGTSGESLCGASLAGWVAGPSENEADDGAEQGEHAGERCDQQQRIRRGARAAMREQHGGGDAPEREAESAEQNGEGDRGVSLANPHRSFLRVGFLVLSLVGVRRARSSET